MRPWVTHFSFCVRTATSRGTEECECKQKGVGLTALTSDKAEDKNVIIYW